MRVITYLNSSLASKSFDCNPKIQVFSEDCLHDSIAISKSALSLSLHAQTFYTANSAMSTHQMSEIKTTPSVEHGLPAELWVAVRENLPNMASLSRLFAANPKALTTFSENTHTSTEIFANIKSKLCCALHSSDQHLHRGCKKQSRTTFTGHFTFIHL